MAFPSTGILDSFTRANEGPPPSASWSGPITTGESQTKVVSNGIVPENTNIITSYTNYWNPGTFGPDSEAYSKITTVGNEGDIHKLFCRVVDGGGSADGYELNVINRAATTTVRFTVWRVDNGVRTQLGAHIDDASIMAAGDQFGFEAVSNTLTAYRNSGSWASKGTRTDSTYSAAGNIGVGFTSTGLGANGMVADDFGGGTVVAGAAGVMLPMGMLGTSRV